MEHWSKNWKKAYICSPLSAPTTEGIEANRRKAAEYMRAVSNAHNCRAVAPHAYISLFLNDMDPDERKLGMDFSLNFLATCDVVVVCGNAVSKGMQVELDKACELGMPVFHCSMAIDPAEV
jgi:hypothetical protein